MGIRGLLHRVEVVKVRDGLFSFDGDRWRIESGPKLQAVRLHFKTKAELRGALAQRGLPVAYADKMIDSVGQKITSGETALLYPWERTDEYVWYVYRRGPNGPNDFEHMDELEMTEDEAIAAVKTMIKRDL